MPSILIFYSTEGAMMSGILNMLKPGLIFRSFLYTA